jgi:hypothetical protein
VALPSTTAQHEPPVAQTSSHVRSTVHPVHGPEVPPPFSIRLSQHLSQYPYPRVSPIQAPSPRVAPRLNPVGVSSPRVVHTLPHNSVIPLTPHPAAENAPYMPQGMAGMNLFDTFEEEHMKTTSIPRYNTRARARQHSANQAQFLAPRIFRPLAFTNNQGVDVAPRQATNHIPMANAVINQDTGVILEYRHIIQDETTCPVWNKSAANEFGRLAQGVGGRIEGSNTIFFIPRQAVPTGEIVTYGCFVVDIRPNKPETHGVRLTVGGNLIQYPGDVSTRSADLTTSKFLWNSTIPTEGAKYMCLDVNNFYLGTPINLFEYMCIPIKLISQEIIAEYNTYSPWYHMDTYILKCKNACMPCPKPGSLPTNYLPVA